MPEEISKKLAKVECRIKRKYFLIDFKEYDSVLKDILKKCLNTNNKETIDKLYKEELIKYFEPIQTRLKEQIAKEYMDNQFNYSVTSAKDLLEELKKLVNYLKTNLINEDCFLYDWIIQNYRELGILIKSLLTNNGQINVKKLFIRRDILDFLEIAVDILEIEIENDLEEESTIFNTGSLLRHSLLPKEKTNQLFIKYHNGDLTARDEIMAHNYRLVGRQAYKFLMRVNPKSYTFDDLFQEGATGLMIAIEKFNPELGYNFSTYAIWWIRKTMQRSCQNHDRPIKIPTDKIEILNKIRNRKSELATELGRKVTIEDLAQDLLMPVTKLNEYLTSSNDVVSLQEKLGTGEDDKSAEYFISSDIDVEEEAINRLFQDNIEDILLGFTPKEITIIKMRAGIGYPRTYNLEEVAQIFNVSRERIRQIEKKVRIKINRKDVYVASNYNTKISRETTKIRLNDYFLGVSSGLLAKHLAQLEEEKQKLVGLFYNRHFNLISFKEVGEFFYKEIVDPIFRALYEKDGKLNLEAIPIVNTKRLKDFQNIGKGKLILKRYGPNLVELNPLDVRELKKLYANDWPTFYNYCMKQENKPKPRYLPLKDKYSYLSEEELHQFIRMLTPDEQQKAYETYGNHLDEFNYKKNQQMRALNMKLDKIIQTTLKSNKKNKKSKTSSKTSLSQIPEELKELPANNYLIYTLINGIGYDTKRTTNEVANILQISEEEVKRIYAESCQLLGNKETITPPKEKTPIEGTIPSASLSPSENSKGKDKTNNNTTSYGMYIMDNLKNLPAKNYLVYAMIEGEISFSERFSITKVAEIMKTSKEEIMRIYTETCYMLNNPHNSYQSKR